MESLQLFLDQFQPSGEAESLWLQQMFSFVSDHLSGPAPPADDTSLTGVYQLSVCVVKQLQQSCVSHSLPVSYRPVCVSELLSRQHLSCFSNLCWSTNQHRAWVQEAELSAPGQVLPRVSLLLIGCLREGRDGEWRLTDSSGSVRCECLSPSPLWLNRPVFLPHWNYIPHDAPGSEAAGGWVELIGPPVVLCPGAEQGLAVGPEEGAGLSKAVGVKEAADFLKNRSRGQRVSLVGQVVSVCPQLDVSGTSFFCFSLTDDSAPVSLPVLVKGSRLWWAQCVCVGQRVCVTALRVCVLRGWRENNILCVTERSEIHTDYTHPAAHTYTPAATSPPPVMSQVEDCEKAEPERDTGQSAARMKKSRVISYQGTVTEVVSEGAGLYVMDKRVGLCLAYQPALRRKLRTGDTLELHHVHFLYRPCPDFLPSMLCTCLRSSVRVTSFSGGGAGGLLPRLLHTATCPGDGALPRLLLQGGRGVSEYLWSAHLSSKLQHSLVPGVLKQCVCVLSWKLMECVWRGQEGQRRDIYCEMLDEPHSCPLTQYRADQAVPQVFSVSALIEGLQTDSWSSVSLRSLLPPGGGLSSSQINSALSWSCRTLTSDPPGDTSRRPLVVGVLELPSPAGQTLQLRDGTGTVACVVTETSEGGGQRAAFNTAWIGCLVCVEKFTMVTERFLQSDFPSDQHLDQDKYITHKHCRFYLQFSLDQLHILSPSIAMETHLRGPEPGGDVTEEEEEPSGGKRRRRGDPRPCVSMVIRVQQKESVALRNSGAGSHQEEAGLTASFSVTAAVIGPVVSWGRDPKNRPLTDREAEPERKDKLVLVLSGVSARWFPLLQPGCFYRLIAANTQEPSVLIGCAVSGRRGVELHADSTLQVRTDWRFHTLTRPLLLLHTCTQTRSPPVSTLSEVLDCSSEVVCFQAQVTDRISVTERSRGSCAGVSAGVCAGVRLTVCDQSGRSLQVYLDLSHTPYPPGLLPGNTLLLSAFQRRVSRSGGVYCSQLQVSSLTVTSLGDSSCVCPPPAPMMHLGVWTGSMEQRCFVGRVRGHVVCLLLLQLRWSCSLCGGLYTQSCSSAQCGSSSSVFQSTVKLVIDDGTGEAHVWFSGAQVRALLGLADSQWEGLQRALRVRGHIRVYPQGRSLVCDSEDPLLHFLLCVCSSEVVCRQLSLTCRKQKAQRSEEMKRFSRGDRDFMTRVTPPLKLTCTHLNSD